VSFRESEFIAWATGDAPTSPHLLVGPGDDAAVLADGTLVCTDAVVEGVHFEPGTAPEWIVRKALGRALSDLCAMGGAAETVHVAALLPAGCDGYAHARALAEGVRRFGVALAGGDTKPAPAGALAYVVTATGRCRSGAPWLRSGARPGDRLCVSGPLGGSRSGRHLRVEPRCDVVTALRAGPIAVHACIDLSDGLGRNLPQLCAASGVGALVQAAEVPIHRDVEPGRDGLAAALGDGEDFELLLAIEPSAELPAGLTLIGEISASAGLRLARDGTELPWPVTGCEQSF
jgi:thiamine-monophosphate kinase